MAEVREIVIAETARAGVDLAVLLGDLDRLVSALRELPPRSLERSNLLQRGFLLWQLELERAGTIEIERLDEQFQNETLGMLPCADSSQLVRAMQVHDLRKLRITAALSADDFSRFVNLLALPTAHLDEMCEGKFAGRLYASSSASIEINDVPRIALVAAKETRPARTRAPTDPFEPKSHWPKLEEDPLEAPAMAMVGEKLRLSLRELDRCESDVLYDTLVDRALVKARQLWQAGFREESYRVLLVLSAHASDDTEALRSRQRKAERALTNFVDGEHIGFLIARALSCETGGVRPTQILLQVADKAASAVLDALDAETDSNRSRQLAGMLLALGEAAVPVLSQTFAQRSGRRLQLAVRLAGELQNPKLVPALASVFLDSGPALRREAGMALVNIGNFEACDVLIKALSNESPELARRAALCLGILGANQATKPLLAALRRAIGERSYRVATDVIRALAQMDHSRHDIFPVIGQVFERAQGDSGRIDRSELRATKCAALEIAASCSRPEADDLLMAATRDPDETVSQKAHEILNERDLRRLG